MRPGVELRDGAYDELYLIRPYVQNEIVTGVRVAAVLRWENQNDFVYSAEAWEGTHRDTYQDEYENRATRRETIAGIIPAFWFEEEAAFYEVHFADIGLDWPVWWTEEIEYRDSLYESSEGNPETYTDNESI